MEEQQKLLLKQVMLQKSNITKGEKEKIMIQTDELYETLKNGNWSELKGISGTDYASLIRFCLAMNDKDMLSDIITHGERL